MSDNELSKRKEGKNNYQRDTTQRAGKHGYGLISPVIQLGHARCEKFTRPFGARTTKDSYLQDVFKNNYRGRFSDSHGVALTFVLPAL